MSTTDKNKVRAMITYFGRDKFSDTKPERAIDDIAESCGFIHHKPKTISIRDPEDGIFYDLTPDREVVCGQSRLFVNANGVTHRTKRGEQKDRWEARLYAGCGFRILFVDDEILLKHKAFVTIRIVRMLLEAPDDAEGVEQVNPSARYAHA